MTATQGGGPAADGADSLASADRGSDGRARLAVARHLVSLKVRLLVNALTRSVWQMLALVVSFLYGLGVVGLLLVVLGALARRDPELATAWVVLGGSVLVGAWWMLPLVAFGVDSTVPAERLRLFGLRRRDLLLGLGASALVGAPGILTLVLLGGTSVVWQESPAALLAAVPAGLVGITTCVVGSRAWTTLLAPARSSRRLRDLSALTLLVPLAAAVPVAGWLSRRSPVAAVEVEHLADVLGWTPLGAPWAVPAAVADGDTVGAVLRLGIAVVVLVLLVVLWSVGLDKAAVGPRARTGAGTERNPEGGADAVPRHRPCGLLGGRGAFRGLPGRLLVATLGIQTAAVAARCLTYWRRDPRYLGALAVVPFLPLVLALVDRGDGTVVLLACPLVAFLVGWTISADVAYDHTAFWLHVSAGVTGRADRLGRAVAATLVGVPVTAAVVVGVVWTTDRWADLPAVAGVTVGVLLTALGISSVVSARFVYPVPLPGDGPFSSPQGSAVADLATQAGGWGVLALLALPETVVGVVAVVQGDALLGWVACALGVGLGVFWWVAGVRIGAAVYDHRAPELLQQVVAGR